MGPKQFVTCFVCCREFGSRSIAFHEPKCLERWRAINRTLPPEKRSPTPVKPVGWKDCEDTTWTCTSCQITVLATKRGEHAAACFSVTRQVVRPRTTVINKSPRGGAANKSGGAKPNAPPNAKNGKLTNAVTVVATKKVVRPQTKILRKPTPNIKHPVIRYDSKENLVTTGPKGKNSKRSKGGEREAKQKKWKQSPTSGGKKGDPLKNKDTSDGNSHIPTPCRTCNRNVAPERLHSHLATGTRANKNGQKGADGKGMEKAPSTEDSAQDNKGKGTLQSGGDTPEQTPKQDPTKGFIKVRRAQNSLQPYECYICSRVFGKTSLPLHEINCLERWKRVNEALPAALRKPFPRKPNQPDSKRPANDNQSGQPVQAQLVPCVTCGRTFFSERLPVHQRVCKGKPAIASPQTLTLRPASVDILRPNQSVTCYICGRQFGNTPIPVHESQCLMKWKRDNEKLPQHLQRTQPNKPLFIFKDDGTVDIDAMADEAWKSHLEQLVPCPSCGRTFFPDRLAVHERSCKGVRVDILHKGSKSA